MFYVLCKFQPLQSYIDGNDVKKILVPLKDYSHITLAAEGGGRFEMVTQLYFIIHINILFTGNVYNSHIF